jgi:hypothetical protein
MVDNLFIDYPPPIISNTIGPYNAKAFNNLLHRNIRTTALAWILLIPMLSRFFYAV